MSKSHCLGSGANRVASPKSLERLVREETLTDINDPLGVSIIEAARLIGCGRTHVYMLVKCGKLKTIKLGSRTIVTTRSIQALFCTPSDV